MPLQRGRARHDAAVEFIRRPVANPDGGTCRTREPSDGKREAEAADVVACVRGERHRRHIGFRVSRWRLCTGYHVQQVRPPGHLRRCTHSVRRRVRSRCPGSILCRLSQSAQSQRGGRAPDRSRFPDPGCGPRIRQSERGAAKRRRGSVGARDQETPRRLDAAGRAPAAGRRGGARGHELAGDEDRRRRDQGPEPGQKWWGASPQPDRIRQRDP